MTCNDRMSGEGAGFKPAPTCEGALRKGGGRGRSTAPAGARMVEGLGGWIPALSSRGQALRGKNVLGAGMTEGWMASARNGLWGWSWRFGGVVGVGLLGAVPS